MDFRLMFQTWVAVLIKPGEEVFEAERQKASATLTTALVWVVLAAVVTALLGLLQRAQQQFSSSLAGMEPMLELMPAESRAQIETIANTGTFDEFMRAVSLGSIVIAPIFFVIGIGILHLVASVLGGQGQFGRYAYLNATFSAPISIISSLFGFVPWVGGCVGFILLIYQLALAYFATKVEYGLSAGRAIVVVLAPVLFIVVLVACGMIVVFSLIFAGGQS